MSAKQLKHSKHPVSQNSASAYYSTFRGLLKIAYIEKMFKENLNDYLEKIDCQDTQREYLTLDEVKRLAATPCKIPVLKAAMNSLIFMKNSLNYIRKALLPKRSIVRF